MIKGFTRRFKPIEILTEDQLGAIEGAVLGVLWQTGMVFEHEKALKIFKENGCDVNFDKKLVKFPPELVLECIHKTPKYWCAKARDPKHDLQVGGDNVIFINAPGKDIVDLDSMEPRSPTREEFCDYVRVLDGLPTLHMQAFYPFFGFEGVPSYMAIPEGLAAKIRNSTKVQIDANVGECDIFNLKMGKALGIDVGDCFCASAPLTVYHEAISCGLRAAENDAFCVVISGCTHGASGPATIAGSTVTDLAECLSLLVLLQIVNPGMRIYSTDQTNPQNMRTGAPFFDSTGSNLHIAACNQMWRHWGIPHSYSGAGYTNSKRIDFQSAYERTMSVLTSVLTGANIIMLHGGLYGEMSAHALMAVLDDDIAGMVGRFIGGIEVNDETLAVDLINEVGPIPGQYLNKAHTRKWWKNEQYLPKSIDMLTYAQWMDAGKKSCLDYAKERVEQILASHEPTPLTDDQNDAIDSILEEARAHYLKLGLVSEEEMKKYSKILGRRQSHL